MGYKGSKTPKHLRDLWQTPTYLYQYLNRIYKFDVDLACTTQNCRAPKGIYFDQGMDALKEDWRNYGNTGFCNPPYSNIDPWVEKAIELGSWGFNTIMVIPTLNGDKRDEMIINNANVTIICGRVGFINPETGKKISGSPRGTMICDFDMFTGRQIRVINRSKLEAA